MSRALDIREAVSEAAEVRSWTCLDCDTMVEAEGARCRSCEQYLIDVQSGIFDDPIEPECSNCGGRG